MNQENELYVILKELFEKKEMMYIRNSFVDSLDKDLNEMINLFKEIIIKKYPNNDNKIPFQFQEAVEIICKEICAIKIKGLKLYTKIAIDSLYDQIENMKKGEIH